MPTKVVDSSPQFSKPAVERAVISLCLQSMSTFLEVSSKLSVIDFLSEDNRSLWTVLCSLSNRGIQEFDLVSVSDASNDLGIFDSIGGYSYLDSLFRSEVSKANLGSYVSQIIEASLLYKLDKKLKEGTQFVQDNAVGSKLPAHEIVNTVEDSILSVSLDTLKVEDGKHLSTGLLDRLKTFEEHPETIRGLRSGFPILDRITNGFKPNGLYVLGARPKRGKSLTLMSWAINIAKNEEKPVLLLDTEMSTEEVQTRALSHISGVPERIIVNGLYVGDKRLTEAIYCGYKILEKIPFYHKFMPSFKIEDVKSMARKYKVKENIGAFLFDYIKLVEMNDAYNETQTLGHIASSLKDLAGVLDIPVITAAQLSRDAENKSLVSSDMIGESDRILRYCSVLMALSLKTKKEIDEQGLVCGTHRLQILDNRSGSSLYSGIDLILDKPTLTITEAEVQSSNALMEQKRIEEEAAAFRRE